MRHRIDFGYYFILLLVASFVYACANKGAGPMGGPKDETPPRVLKSVPENGALNFKKKEIQVDFDENITLEKLADNVVVSPPQKQNPDIRAQGKKLIVRFEEDMQDSTTYSINFGDAVVDLNEKNPISNYRFAFSTGPEIDTLGIAGTVINAEDLNPIQGVYVGIYEETSDSVFQQKPFMRIGKTDENGYFTIDNIKPGTYQLYALGDNNRDYYFQPGEGLAMLDSLITPTFRIEELRDTIWADSTHIDTIQIRKHTHLLPDDILLRYFKEGKKRQYLVKTERPQPEKFTLYFGTTLAELPEIEPLNFDWEDHYILQRSNTLDTLSYWLTDSLTWGVDTLKMAVSYLKTDSIFQLVPTTDTLNIAMRKSLVRARQKKPDEELKVPPLNFNNNITSAFEVYNPIVLKMGEPLAVYDTSKIALRQKVDTVFNPVKYSWYPLDSTQMAFAIKTDWEPGGAYELLVDSAAFTSIYGKVSDKYKATFKVRALEEYSEIKVVLTNYDPRAIIQVLNTKDIVLATLPAEKEGTLFQYLKPTDYYLRMFIDENGNGKWDTGDLNLRRQPEEVFYYPHKLTLKANFEFTETWNHTETPLLKQKPVDLQKESATKK